MHPITGISIVIPNYNGVNLLPQTLPPLLEAIKTTGMAYEVIVADDASTDGSVDMLARDFPSIQVLQLPSNGGFSKTANQGIAHARYPWVLLLNSDVKLTLDYFEKVLPYTKEKMLLGVTGQIIGWEDDTIQDGGKYPVFQGAKMKTSYDYVPTHLTGETERYPCFYLSGANAFLNKEVFLKIGGFNELFSPFYVEDAELSLRAWRLGYASYYAHSAICRHRTSSTIGIPQRKKEVQRIYNRNKYLLHALHLDGIYLLNWWAQLKLELLFRLLTFRWMPLYAVVDFLKLIPAIRKSRKNLRNLQPTTRLVAVPVLFARMQQTLQAKSIQLFKR